MACAWCGNGVAWTPLDRIEGGLDMDQNRSVVSLPIAGIAPDPNQPRKTFNADTIRSLAQSLQRVGQLSPIVVRPGEGEEHVIVVGERRWRAAKEAGFTNIDCIIRCDIDERKAREMQFAENHQRQDIPPLEQAMGFQEYLDRYGVSQSEMSRRTGIPQRTISDRLALLSLPSSVRARVATGEIGPHEAARIARLPAGQQQELAESVASGRIGGRVLDKVVKLARAMPHKSVQQVLGELNATQHPGASRSTPSAAPKTASTAHDGLQPTAAGGPSEIDILLAAVSDFGAMKQAACRHLKDGVCTAWSWETRESIPGGIGDPVWHNGEWHIKPSETYCAICFWDSYSALEELEGQVCGNPLAGLRYQFKCDCGAKGHIAAAVKCTACGKEVWWGWWPEE